MERSDGQRSFKQADLGQAGRVCAAQFSFSPDPQLAGHEEIRLHLGSTMAFPPQGTPWGIGRNRAKAGGNSRRRGGREVMKEQTLPSDVDEELRLLRAFSPEQLQ